MYIYTKPVFKETSFVFNTDINVTISVREFNSDGGVLGTETFSTQSSSYAVDAKYTYLMHERFDSLQIDLTNIPRIGDTTGYSGFRYTIGSISSPTTISASDDEGYSFVLSKDKLPAEGSRGVMKITGLKQKGINIYVECLNTGIHGLTWTLKDQTQVQPWGNYYYKIETAATSYTFAVDIHKPAGSMYTSIMYNFYQNGSSGSEVSDAWSGSNPYTITQNIIEGNTYRLVIKASVAFAAKTLTVNLLEAGNFSQSEIIVHNSSQMTLNSVNNQTNTKRTTIQFRHNSESGISFYLTCEGANSSDNYKFTGCNITNGWDGWTDIHNKIFSKVSQQINGTGSSVNAILVNIPKEELNEIYYSLTTPSLTLTMITTPVRKVRIVNNLLEGLVYSEIDFGTLVIATNHWTNFHQVNEYLYTTDARNPDNFKFRFSASTGSESDIDDTTKVSKKYSDVELLWYPNESVSTHITITKNISGKFAYVEYATDLQSQMPWNSNYDIIAKLEINGIVNYPKILFTTPISGAWANVSNSITGEIYLNSTSQIWDKNSSLRASAEIHPPFETWNYLKLYANVSYSREYSDAAPDTVRARLYGYTTDDIVDGGST